MIPAGNPGPYTGEGNRTWLVRGSYPTLIDAGTGEASHSRHWRRRWHRTAPLARVIVTHAHSDHIQGVAKLAARWPDVRFSKVPWSGARREVLSALPAASGWRRDRSRRYHARVVATPGHAPDHIALWHAGERTVFSGDLLVQGGTVVIPATRGGISVDYLASLERVLALDPAACAACARADHRPSGRTHPRLSRSSRAAGNTGLELLKKGAATPARNRGADLRARARTRCVMPRRRACWRISRSSSPTGGSAATGNRFMLVVGSTTGASVGHNEGPVHTRC